MKRFLTIIIAVCYLCLSIGIPVHLHYCMGKMIEVSLIAQDEDHHCSHCGMDKKSSGNGCCKDEHKIIKNAIDHALVKDIAIKAPFGEYILPVKPSVFASAKIRVAYVKRMARTHAPPLIPPDCPLYIRIGNLRV